MPPVSAQHIEDLVRQADGLFNQGRLRDAQRLLTDAVAMAPRNAKAQAYLGWVLHHQGDHQGGLEHLRKAVSLDGRQAGLHHMLGMALQVSSRAEEALLSFERAIALKPAMPDPYGALASVHERSSRLDKARATIERGIKAVPGDEQLRAIHCAYRLNDAEIDGAVADLRALTAPTVNLTARIRACHTLGVALDKRKDADGAWAAYTLCNSLREQLPQVRWALANDTVSPMIAQQMSVTRAHCEKWLAEEPDDGLPTPAFLVGFPRSGTTMLEQVLGAHPGVVATPERGMLMHCVAMFERLLAKRGAFAAVADAMSGAEVTEMRRAYWDAAKFEIGGAPNGRLLVDKYPVHIGRLGLINRLFPRAKVIVALRDPRDCCLSAYTQYFAHNPAMVKFLRIETTAGFYAELLGLYVALKDVVTTPILTTRYEDTVADLPSHAARMLEFLELPWDDRVLTPEQHAQRRYVNTPSHSAVNQKVNTRARGRWKPYRAHLEPVLPILEPFIERFGYEPSSGAAAAEGRSA